MENNSSTNNNPSSGDNSGVDYKSLVEKLEREKHGMYEEMKSEREKRQALESRFQNMEQEMVRRNPVNSVDENTRWIEGFAKDPKQTLRREFDEHLKPLKEENQKLSLAMIERDCYEWLAEQENTSLSKVRQGGLKNDLQRIIKDRNLGSMPMLSGVQTAYEFYKLEQKAKAESEKERAETVQNTATESVSVPATPNLKSRYKESDIAKMDLPTFQHYQKDIDIAAREGRIDLDISGKK